MSKGEYCRNLTEVQLENTKSAPSEIDGGVSKLGRAGKITNRTNNNATNRLPKHLLAASNHNGMAKVNECNDDEDVGYTSFCNMDEKFGQTSLAKNSCLIKRKFRTPIPSGYERDIHSFNKNNPHVEDEEWG